jgi:tRNA dimethylallyltransferase
MKKVVQILGPTGVGKSEITVKLAEKIDGEIISADSMQVYSDFNIGTSKLNKEEMKDIPHHLIGILSDCSQYNAARFLGMSFAIAEKIVKNGKIPLVCGGTALYLKTMIRGIFPEVKEKKVNRKDLDSLADSRGSAYLWKKLDLVDPEYAKKINSNDRIRIIRALDIYYNQGLPPSVIFKKTVTPFKGYEFIRVGLILNRDKLYKIINDRVDRMFKNGLVDEVIGLRKKYPQDCPPFHSLGYKEISQYLDGMLDWEKVHESIKQHTRNFAKRQLSWFRQEKDIHWFNPDDFGKILDFLEKKLSRQNNKCESDLDE